MIVSLKSKWLIPLLVVFSFGCIAADGQSPVLASLSVKQTLVDNKHSVDGLAGARVVELTPDGQQLLLVSADDNSLAVFNVDANFKLSFSQMFVNSSNIDALNIDGLEGATSLVVSPDGRYAYVVSFYDSGIAIFEKNEKGTYRFIRAIRDGVPYGEVFSEEESVKRRDTLGMLGAYDIAITSDNRQLYVASVASSAVSIFDIKNANDENNKGRQNQT